MSTDLIVRFAGEGGQGQVTAAEGLAEAAARVGYHVQTYATYPSQIKGGPTWAQTRISTKPILHDGDALDVLVVLNRDAYEAHVSDLRDGASSSTTPRTSSSSRTATRSASRSTSWRARPATPAQRTWS